MGPLTIALTKGRIMEDTVRILESAGISVPADIHDSRRYILTSPDGKFRFILSKPTDVPTFVEYGSADMGIVGKDVLLEANRDMYELLDLGIGYCRMCVIGRPEMADATITRVATKYPRIATDFFRHRGQQVEVVYLNGSVELAPHVGLAERIVDLVETGRTLKENGLVIFEEVASITTRVVANRMSFRLKSAVIEEFCQKLRSVVPGGVQR